MMVGGWVLTGFAWVMVKTDGVVGMVTDNADGGWWWVVVDGGGWWWVASVFTTMVRYSHRWTPYSLKR